MQSSWHDLTESETLQLVTYTKEPNIIRGGTPYLSHCDATYVAPPAGGNAVDVLSRDHSISYGVVEEQRELLCGHKLYQQ